jgi:hypothetical protein
MKGIDALLHVRGVLRGVEIRHRIHGAAVHPDLVMKVAAGRTAGRTHQADEVAAADALARFDEDLRKVAVAGLQRMAMFDLDIFAVAADPLGAADSAVGSGIDRRADWPGNVDAVVAGTTPGEGIAAVAEARGQAHFVDRAARRDGERLRGRPVHLAPGREDRAELAVARTAPLDAAGEERRRGDQRGSGRIGSGNRIFGFTRIDDGVGGVEIDRSVVSNSRRGHHQGETGSNGAKGFEKHATPKLRPAAGTEAPETRRSDLPDGPDIFRVPARELSCGQTH